MINRFEICRFQLDVGSRLIQVVIRIATRKIAAQILMLSVVWRGRVVPVHIGPPGGFKVLSRLGLSRHLVYVTLGGIDVVLVVKHIVVTITIWKTVVSGGMKVGDTLRHLALKRIRHRVLRGSSFVRLEKRKKSHLKPDLTTIGRGLL